MLTLPIKKKWFDMILSGEKKEEYREKSHYYFQRFRYYNMKIRNSEDEEFHKPRFRACFRNGYSAGSHSFVAVCWVDIGEGRPEWGAEPGKEYFRLHIESIEGKDRAWTV